MSFVNSVLSAEEQSQIENINRKIPELETKIHECKQDVMKYMDNVYVKYSERPRHIKLLLAKSNDLISEMNSLQSTVTDLIQHEVKDCMCKVSSSKKQLDEINYALSITSQLIEIHNTLMDIKNLENQHDFVQAMIEFSKIRKCMNFLNEQDHIDILKELAVYITTAQFKLINKLTNIFRDHIRLDENLPYTLFVSKDNAEMERILRAFALYKPNVSVLDNVMKFLWKYVFTTIVTCKTTVEINETSDDYLLKINVINERGKDNYKSVFDNVIKVLDFLQAHFKYCLEENVSTLSYIGKDICDNLSELLIKECLNDTIPSNSDGLKKYDVVIADCEILQNKLVECEIFTSNTSSILDHANNIDIHFINKKCQEYLNTAITLMKKDLHDMVEIGTPHDVNKPILESDEFPQCSVSKSCIELTHLIDKIIEVTASSSDICAGRLYCTMQNILHLYGNIVQEHHNKLLQTIPQQVSLFHNNCMYLSHRLVGWGETCLQKFPSVLSIELATFQDKANILKTIGNNAFILCLQQQTKQIEEILKDAGLTSISTLEKLEPVTEKSIRQCLRQQELLKTVWHKVLCYSDYNRSIGYILNFMCNFIIDAIIKLEDISAEASEQLVDIFKVVLTRGPKLFTDPKEIHLFVEGWYKMNELVFLLNSGLIDIDDRWADGKGPLSLQFQPEEIKRIIRALFQNTDMRAAILAKI